MRQPARMLGLVPLSSRVMMTGYRLGVLIGAGLLASCRPAGQEPAPANEAEPAVKLPSLPVAEPPLDREALLLAVARAASAAALGRDDREAQRTLDGDRFELRLRFGCPGAAGQARRGGAFNLSFDSESRVLRLRAAPNVAVDQLPVPPGETIEAVEGFWIGRPWLLSAACPAAAAPLPPIDLPDGEPAAAPPTAHRVAIAQFFTETDPRTGRRNERAYEATETLAEDQVPSAIGYDLVLSGRLKRLPAGRVIACAGPNPDLPPSCVISAQFDRVWLERPDTSELIAEWRPG